MGLGTGLGYRVGFRIKVNAGVNGVGAFKVVWGGSVSEYRFMFGMGSGLGVRVRVSALHQAAKGFRS